MARTMKEPGAANPGLSKNNVRSGQTNSSSLTQAAASLKAVRLSAWRRIRFAVDEQAEALQQRFDRADRADIHLQADARAFEQLAHALCDLWETRRASS